MKLPVRFTKRVSYGLTALVVGVGVALPVFGGQASAAGQVQSRSIQMSSGAAGATATSYNVNFNVATAGYVQGIVVDFCDDSPLIGLSTCTQPTGLDVTASPTLSPSVSVAGQSGLTWSAAGANNSSGYRTLVLTSTGTAAGTVNAGAAVSFTVTTVKNPTTANHTFYARIYTYSTSGGASGYSVAAPGSYVDAGGVALSTSNPVTVTAKIQESLSFCVYTSSCGTGSAVSLGDNNGVLSTAGPFVDKNTKFDISTNANSNAIVRFKSPLPTSGSNTITSINNATPGTAASSAAGTSQFGLCAYQSTGSGLTATSPYNDANCNSTTQSAGTVSTGGVGTAKFAFETATAASTYGSALATKTPGSSSTGTVVMVGNIAPTQQAGIYTNTFDFIATGTY